MAYKPSLDTQISLAEASCISYFRPPYNAYYLDFPDQRHQIIDAVYEADFAAIMVQLDNTNIGGQRIYSQGIKLDSTHYIPIDFRRLEGKRSILT